MPPDKTPEPHAGQVALATGTARGTGQAIAAGLPERGTRIVLGDIDDVSEASDLIGATGHPAVPVTPDVNDPSSIEAAHDRVTDALGRARIAAIRGKHHSQNLFHHNANIQPAWAGGRPDNTSDIRSPSRCWPPTSPQPGSPTTASSACRSTGRTRTPSFGAAW
jgi:NAD(P)-dependent dehydrogenase (short-subunit alcohol dehydrogenase family)